MKLSNALLARCLLIGSTVILVLVPFHATLTVWLAALGVNYTAVRLWKEVLLAVLFAGAVTLLVRNAGLRKGLGDNDAIRRASLLIGAYVLLHVLAGGVALLREEVNLLALGYAFISNLRFLAFFLVTVMVGTYYASWLRQNWRRLLLWPAAVVVGFGLLQMFVLPYDFLQHFGYEPDTIQPYIAIDNKVEYTRAQSTLRGPNPLGAYLVVIVTALAALFVVRRKKYARIAALLTASILVLYGSYSRSAWIGAITALGVLAWGLTTSAKLRKYVLVAGAAALVLFAGSLYVLRDNDTVQNVVFHTNEQSRSAESSNEQRAGALVGGIEDVVREPLGRGPGTAGPASVHNDKPSRISENYFIQIGQEVGVIGLAIFVGICAVVGWALWQQERANLPALVLCASLVGLTVVNLVSHAWADDTLAYIWWGLAGATIATAGLPTSKAGSTASLLAPSTFFSSSAPSPYRLYGSLRASLRKRTGHSSAKVASAARIERNKYGKKTK